jgi:hypothetical protein
MSCHEQFRTFLYQHRAETNSAFETVADIYVEEEVAMAATTHASLTQHVDSESGFEDISSQSDDASLDADDFC